MDYQEPTAAVLDLLSSWIKPKVTYAFARLGVADALQPTGSSKTCRELAAALEAHEDSLYRLLRTAGQLGLVQEEEGDNESASDSYIVRGGRRFVLTSQGEILKDDHPSQMRYLAITLGLPAQGDSQSKLFESVKAGLPGCKFAFGEDSVFPIFDRDEYEGQVFNQAMTSSSIARGGIVATSYNFSRCKKIVDIGGSKGTLVQQILDAHPGLPLGISLDRKEVIDTLPPSLPQSRFQFASADFFEPLPEAVHSADAVLMKHIMHDWGDTHCQKILENCKAILAPGGVIICIDMVMAESAGAAPKSLPLVEHAVDLLMMSVTNGGKERTLKEWEQLAASVGLKLLPAPEGGSLVWGIPPATMVVMEPI